MYFVLFSKFKYYACAAAAFAGAAAAYGGATSAYAGTIKIKLTQSS